MSSKNNNTLERKEFFLNTTSKFCDKCGTPYTSDDVNIIQNAESAVIIHFTCHNCKSKNILNWVFGAGFNNKFPVNTDLEVSEIGKFSKKSVVSLDEILDLYSHLKENKTVSV